MSYRTDIDGLRAVAVLAVLGFHLFPEWIPGGFVGVDVFFVISGYLISGLIWDALAKSEFTYRGFYARRARRILPALLTVVATCLIAGRFLLLPDEYRQLGKHAFAGMTFATNAALWREGGYFDVDGETKPMQHLWSLSLEKQFYAIWPLMLVILWRRGGSPLRSLLVLSFASLFSCVVLTMAAPEHAFYAPWTRLWEMGAGAVLRHVVSVAAPLSLRVRSLVGVLGGVLLALSFTSISATLQFPGWIALLPVTGAGLILLAGRESILNRVALGSPPVVWIGLISYPLYLWHWPFLSFTRIVVGAPPSGKARVVIAALSLVAAWLTYLLVERPLRRAQLTGRFIAALSLVSILIASIGLATFAQQGFANSKGANGEIALDLAPDVWGTSNSEPVCAFEVDRLGGENCRSSGTGPPRFALWGDSHAQHLFPGLHQKTTSGWILFTRNLCPPVLGMEVVVRRSGCETFNRNVVGQILSMPQIETVVLSFLSDYPTGTVLTTGRGRARNAPVEFSSRTFSEKSPEQWFQRGLDETVTALESTGKRVVVIEDIPSLPFHPRDCVRALLMPGLGRDECSLSRSDALDRQEAYRTVLSKLQARHPGVLRFSAFDQLCDVECRYRDGTMSFYRDRHHLSLRGSAWMAKRFLAWLKDQDAQDTNLSAVR